MARTKREVVRRITQMIKKAEGNEKLALIDWRNHLLRGTQLNPAYSKYLFNATMNMYEDEQKEKEENQNGNV